jgi:phosphoglycolate phosphatase-like HAD superfamily hydrolase
VEESGIAASSTWLIGDSARDLVAAKSAGVAAALVCTGNGTRTLTEGAPTLPSATFPDLIAAARALTQFV